MRLMRVWDVILIALAAGVLVWIVFLFLPGPAEAECRPEPITPNTPTGIAGCEVWGDGTASHYGPGNGVAMNWCTWEAHAGHARPCGMVTITSHQTGISVTVPVVTFCDCYTGTANERIVDLQYGVVAALGLSLEQGLYPVTVWPAGHQATMFSAGAGADPFPAPGMPPATPAPTPSPTSPPAPTIAPPAMLPDTSTQSGGDDG